ncbi:hypothetical protein VMCG_09621 [Cytospora schulzeri]|uniref:J domain-containing protein n=1 Tax=Cytospora schulzeri TaxID=448051 RepID=A0A423VEJ1_9PEZI|nr:hypothetical protein VMCG_09621 [Valsa malicola]
MGAQQSSQEHAAGAQGGAAVARKTCYYDLLGIDRSAEDAEIRKAYKKKALELHPDRNFNDVENATNKFAEVQTAYEVLSDPQERAWYDSHRDAILRGDADEDDAPPEHYNVRLTTTEEIMNLIGRFNSSVPFNDSPNGFFSILDITFGQLATEEAAACDWDGRDPVEYPPFGSSTDDYDSVAKPFYSAWSGFATAKSFSWKEKWRLAEAPDRRVRRLMEKENKKMRDEAIRDFNDAVRSLVAFVKKRDPRYVPNTQSEADRQKILRDSAAAQAARAREANRQKLSEAVVADWAHSREDEDDHDDEYNNEYNYEYASEEESEPEEFECVVCDKIFKSEKQLEAHEKSKKHTKAVQQLRRQMKKEGLAFEVDEPVAADQPSPEVELTEQPGIEEDLPEGNKEQPAPTTKEETQKEEISRDVEGDEPDSSSDDILDDEYAPREVVEERLAPGPKDDISGSESGVDDKLSAAMTGTTLNDEEDLPKKKLGKAKAKKARRAAKQETEAREASQKCGVCYEEFDSRTKLFRHIRDEGHAELKPVGQAGQAGKSGKKKSKR